MERNGGTTKRHQRDLTNGEAIVNKFKVNRKAIETQLKTIETQLKTIGRPNPEVNKTEQFFFMIRCRAVVRAGQPRQILGAPKHRGAPQVPPHDKPRFPKGTSERNI